MSSLNIVLMDADFSANYLKKGTPIISSEETADAILESLAAPNEAIEDALRLFFYQLKQNNLFSRIKSIILPCISSNLSEAKRNWINTSEYIEGVNQTDYGEHKGIVFDQENKTIYKGGSVQAAKNYIINPSNSLKAGNVTVCFCTKGQDSVSKPHIGLLPLSYTSLTDIQISFYESGKNNTVQFGAIEETVNKPLVGTWKCTDNDGIIMAYSAAKKIASKNTNPTEWTDKETNITNFGSIAEDTPVQFILLSEALERNEMITLYDIVETFLSSL